ncbi:MAG: hypothetical protein AAF830_02260 [Pseudomonadota bacterium]
MKNIQVIDDAENATFSVFQATESEFNEIFPLPDQDMAFAEDVVATLGERAHQFLQQIWSRPILKRHAHGIHGTVFYGFGDRRQYFPESMREIDWEPSYLNEAQRVEFAKHQ